MKTKTKALLAALAVVLMVAASVPVVAHHAFGAEFDPNLPIILKGPVTRVEWTNPHTWIYLEVTKEDGTKEEWGAEGGTPNTLLRRGLNKQTLPVGTIIVVDGYQSKDRSTRMNARDLTLEDGTKFFVAGSGTGAPYDKKGPRKRTPNRYR